MIGGNAFSRRAEEFDAAVCGSAPADERHAELLDLVAAMRSVPQPTARPDFVSDLRGRLMSAAAEMPAPAPARRTDEATTLRLTPKQRRGSRERRLAAVVGGFAVVAASGSMAVASQSSLPGDVLYPVKRAIENAHANLESSPQGKAHVLLQNANTRLTEVEKLSQRQDAGDADNAGEISETLQAFKEQTNQASSLAIDDFSSSGDADVLTQVRDFATTSMGRLSALDNVLPTGARAALIAAAQTVRQVDSAAYDACPTCGGSQITQLPSFVTQPLSATLRSVLKHPLAPSTKQPLAPQSDASQPSSGATATAPPVLPSQGPSPSGTPSNTPKPLLPPILPTDGSHKGLVPDTLDGLTRGLLGTGKSTTDSSPSGDKTTTSSGSDSNDTNLIKSITGLLGLG